MSPNTIRCFLMFWMLLFCAYGGDATLKTSFVEDICSYKNAYRIDMKYQNTGILMSTPAMHIGDFMDCRITFLPRPGSGVVLSIYRYDLLPEDQLIVEDSDRHKIALIGSASFPNEKKSIISEGRMVLHYKMNNTNTPHFSQRGFQFTFTGVQNYPCVSDEFPCKNGKCISKQLVCKGHNHCGDNSENENCVPKNTIEEQKSYRQQSVPNTVWIISIGVAASVLFIVVVVFVVVLVRMRKKGPTSTDSTDASSNVNSNNNLQSVSAAVDGDRDLALSVRNPQPSAYVSSPQFQHPTSFISQIRRSLRGLRAPKKEENSLEETKPEVYQVPSMYPSLDQLPSAPALEGVENTNFTIEE